MKKNILFSIITIFAIIGCGGNGDDYSQSKMVITISKDFVNPEKNFNGINSSVMFSADYADSPFSKLEGLGFQWYPAVQMFTANNGNYKAWNITNKSRLIYDPYAKEQHSFFVTNDQNLEYTACNKFYDYGKINASKHTFVKEIEAPEQFEVDYIMCSFKTVSIYGLDDNNKPIYAPHLGVYIGSEQDPGNYYRKLNPNDPPDTRMNQDATHYFAPENFKSYSLYKNTKGEPLLTDTHGSSVIYSSKISSPVQFEIGDPFYTKLSEVMFFGNYQNPQSELDELKKDIEIIINGLEDMGMYEGKRYGEGICSGGRFVVLPMSYLKYGDRFAINTEQALSLEIPFKVTIDFKKIIAKYTPVAYDNVSYIHAATDDMKEAPLGAKLILDESIIK